MRSRTRFAAAGAALVTGTALLLMPALPAQAATVYYVDNTNGSCSNTGSGTSAVPFCTIGAAAKKAVTAGDDVVVAPGIYREQVNPGGSGTAATPIVFESVPAGALVLGTQDVSDPAGWTATGTNAWSRPYAPPTAPTQVFVDGQRLALASGPSSTTPNTWFWDGVAKVLYVDAGGPNPGIGHVIEAGAQNFGFSVSGRSGVVVRGFTARGQNNSGFRATGSTDVTFSGVTAQYANVNGILIDTSTGGAVVRDCEVSGSGSHGIKLNSSAGALVHGCSSHDNLFSGIALSSATGATVENSTAYGNAVPAGGSSTAVGIDVNGSSTDAVIRNNTLHDNQDSGVQVYNGSSGALITRNVSYRNGDHGFDTNKTTGVTYLNNTSYGNHRDGFSVEGTSSGATLANNIAVDNGTTAAEFDIWVDPGSTPGTTLDRDIAWNSVAAPTVKYGTTVYASLTDFSAATGLEAHGQAHDPRFVNAAGADFRLSANSPALDAADAGAAGFQAADHDGQTPLDDVSVPDTGAGSPSFADLGALEAVPPAGGPFSYAPNAALVVSPLTGDVPPTRLATADASGSSDPDGSPIASYTFDFGDGTVIGPQAAASATHSFTTAGDFTVKVTVVDTGGRSSATSQLVHLTQRVLVTYNVDVANPACSDAGAGTAAAPFCSISAAAARTGPGDTVLVAPGTYREQVTVTGSGAPGYTTTFLATAPGVNVVGTDDLSGPAGWSATTATTWQRAYAPANAPTQVFLDGARLAPTGSSTAMPPGTWFFDAAAQQLYVDLGGADPSSGHTLEASARTYGFKLWNVHDVTLRGFAMRGQNSMGVSLLGDSAITLDKLAVRDTATYGIEADTVTASTISGSEVSTSASVGIRLASSSGILVQGNSTHDNGFHGISLNGSSGNQVVGNTSYRNVKPGVRSATGIDVNNASPNNLVAGNTTYANQDSGIELYNGSNGSVVTRNVTYDNGDHGIDNLGVTGELIAGNTVVGNVAAGINLEGGSSGSTVRDNISVDNGIASPRTTGDIRVDTASVPGTTIDYDLVWVSSASPVFDWDNVVYSSYASFRAATGQEQHGKNADAAFVSLSGRDLRLSGDSPAIDAGLAGAPGLRAADHDGTTAVDDPLVLNSGGGTPGYTDLGAYEYVGPLARLSLSPTSGVAPVTVTANAGTTTTLGAAVASYTFDFGDGTVLGPQAGTSAQHLYTSGGTFTVTVTVADASGLTDRASATVTVQADRPPTAALTVSPATAVPPADITVSASGSSDTDNTPIASYTFTCGDGTGFGPQAGPTGTCHYTTTGTFTVSVAVRDTAGLVGTASRTVSIVVDKPPTASLQISPGSGKVGKPMTLDASASSDPDPTPIATYTFACGNGVTVGPQASSRTTCTYTRSGTFTATVTVTDTAGKSATATAVARVK